MSGDLTVNKIMGAVLATGLAIMGVKIGSEMIFETHAPEKAGYHIEVAEVEAAGGGAAAADTPPDWGTVLPAADIAAGEAAFKQKCTSCHTDTNGGANMTGPNLWGIVGRGTASHAGYAYSEAMTAHKAEAANWTYDQLYGFLGGPGKWVKGTKMSFAGVKKPEDRIALIAYLRTMGSSGYAIPAPDPSRAPGAAAPAEGAAPAATPPAGEAAPAAAAPAPAAH